MGQIEWLQRGAKARTTKAKGRIQNAEQLMKDLAELRSRNTQAGVLLYATVLPLAPEVPKSAPGFAARIDSGALGSPPR